MKHGNTEITEWAQHEDESHDARYGAETFEAREKKFGTIIKKNPNFPSGTHLQGYIKTNRAELRKVFGNPNMGESGDGKAKGKEWNLVLGGKRVTIYDYREKDKKGTKYFNIGGDGKYSALILAQILSIHRNERVYAKETVPKWLEDKRQYQQVKSIDEHPDLTYERAKEYEDNRRRYRAETFEAEKIPNLYDKTMAKLLKKRSPRTNKPKYNREKIEQRLSNRRKLCYGGCEQKKPLKDMATIDTYRYFGKQPESWMYMSLDKMPMCISCMESNWVKNAETSGQWEIGEQLDEAQMNAEFLYYYVLNEKGESPADFDTLEEAQAYVANSNEPLEIYERRSRDDEEDKMDKKMNAEDQNTDLLKWIEDYLWDNDKKGYQAYHAHRKSLGLSAEGKKRSGLLSDPFDELSLDSGGIKKWLAVGILGGLAYLGYSKWK